MTNTFLRKIVPDWITVIAKMMAYKLYRFVEKKFNGPFDKYDFQTIDVIKHTLKYNSNWVDIGAHKGHILKELLKTAPGGRSYAFEPIPYLYNKLQKCYGNRVSVYNMALSDLKGVMEFTHVIDRPAISGLVKREIQSESYRFEKINVQVEKLDDIIPSDVVIDLIKIDVEGAELQVLKGAEKILCNSKPIVLFEFGQGGADLYNTTPEMVFSFFTSCGYALSTLEYFLKHKAHFTMEEFIGQYTKGYNYFFIAYDINKQP